MNWPVILDALIGLLLWSFAYNVLELHRLPFWRVLAGFLLIVASDKLIDPFVPYIKTLL